MQLFHVTPSDNVASILNEGLRPMIGPRSAEIGEWDEQIYCFTSRDAAEDGVMNWLGDEIGDGPISLLVIDASTLAVDVDTVCSAWEARVKTLIPPSLILDVISI